MKIYDVTQELFSCHVYPGDKAPSYTRVSDMEKGAHCNITEFEMNAHNGTHIDAPRHFVKDGITIEQLDLNTLIGKCRVVEFKENVTRDMLLPYQGVERLLVKGGTWLTVEGAEALSELGVRLVGVEHQSIAGEGPSVPVHVAVLSKGIIAVEGLDLSAVPEGEYFLFAAPLKLGGSEGSPCRAVLIQED